MQLAPNQIFAGRYRLLNKIGIGGFSEVWRVADEMAEERVVVLKIYAPERGLDEFGIKQFRREYAITLDLNHPNLLKANHFDIADGSPYLIMPYCEGGSLYGKLQETGTMTEKQVAEMLAQVAGALDYLHRNDVIHQDIKPDNILINRHGDYLLTDFGISSKLRSTLQKSTTTAKAMTVAYAPPEKFKGNSIVGAEGDVFSLGVLMYEMLTDNLPWNGMGGAYLSPNSEAPQLPAGYSPALSQLIQKCVQFDAAQRPQPAQMKVLANAYLAGGNWFVGEAKKEYTRKTEVINPTAEKFTKPEAKPEPKTEKQTTNQPRSPNNIGVIATIFIHVFGLISHLMGVFAFILAGVVWSLFLFDMYEYRDNSEYDALTGNGFSKVLMPIDYLFYLLNVSGFSLWLYFCNKLMIKQLVLAGHNSRSVFTTSLVYSGVALLLPALILAFSPSEKEIEAISPVLWGQLVAALVMVGILFGIYIKKFAFQPREAIQSYVVWWRPIVVAFGCIVISIALLAIRLNMMN